MLLCDYLIVCSRPLIYIKLSIRMAHSEIFSIVFLRSKQTIEPFPIPMMLTEIRKVLTMGMERKFTIPMMGTEILPKNVWEVR